MWAYKWSHSLPLSYLPTNIFLYCLLSSCFFFLSFFLSFFHSFFHSFFLSFFLSFILSFFLFLSFFLSFFLYVNELFHFCNNVFSFYCAPEKNMLDNFVSYILGSTGTVGSEVASETRGPGFEYSRAQLLLKNYLLDILASIFIYNCT